MIGPKFEQFIWPQLAQVSPWAFETPWHLSNYLPNEGQEGLYALYEAEHVDVHGLLVCVHAHPLHLPEGRPAGVVDDAPQAGVPRLLPHQPGQKEWSGLKSRAS